MKLSKLNLFVLAVATLITVQNTFSVVSNFNKAQLTKCNYAIVKCSASWCGPCQAMIKPYNNLSNLPEFKDIKFMSLDFEDKAQKAFAVEHKVQSLPTFLFFKNGKLTGKFSGSRTKSLLQNEIRKLKKQADSKTLSN